MAERRDAERLAALRDLLVEVQFLHPGERASRVDAFYAAERTALVAGVRRVLVYALRQRAFWARRHTDGCDVARAVAYQSVAGMLQRAVPELGAEQRGQAEPVGEWIG